MKILFLAHSFPRRVGDPAGAFLLTLAQRLQARGHELAVVAPHDAGLPLEESIADVHVFRFRYASDSEETLAYKGTMADQVLQSWSARLRLLRFMHAYRARTREVLGSWRPDVVNVHWWFPGAFAVYGLRAMEIPWVITSHGTDLFLLDRKASARRIAGPIFRSASAVTVISSPLVARVEQLGVQSRDIAVIPMPVEQMLLAPVLRDETGDAAAVHLLFVGRLVERKGTEYALRALGLLLSRGVAARLTVVGDGPDRARLEALVAELQIGDRVSFRGQIPADEVPAYMQAADIFLMPAVTDWKGEQEGFGMVIAEAMLSELPVIATRTGGVVDLVSDGDSGVLVPERDQVALADAVQMLAADRNRRRTLARAGREAVLRRFHPDVIAERFEQVYLQALRKGTAQPE